VALAPEARYSGAILKPHAYSNAICYFWSEHGSSGVQAHEYSFAINSALAAGLLARDTTTSIRPVHPEQTGP